MSAEGYYTAATLAAAAGVSRRTFTRHLGANVGQVREARVTVPGLKGVRFAGVKCRRYLALVRADKGSADNHSNA